MEVGLFRENQEIADKALQVLRVQALDLSVENMGAGVVVEIRCADGQGRR